MAVRILLVCMLCIQPVLASQAVNTQQALDIIQRQHAHLLGDGTDLISFYYFGSYQHRSVIGLERVGDDYLPKRWLLLFDGQTLLGWYHPLSVFPRQFSQGWLRFPKGTDTPPLALMSAPKTINLQGVPIQFQSASAIPYDHYKKRPSD